MSEKPTPQEVFIVHYTAPKEPPPARHAPVRDSGVIGWLRVNLFSNVIDTISTLIMLVIMGGLLYLFLDWALFKAQWEITFLNLRRIGSGPEFPADEVTRAEISMYILFFLAALSIAYWEYVHLSGYFALVAIAVATLVIPPLTENVPEPAIHYYVDANYPIRQVNFVADEGEKITFTLDPLTEELDFVPAEKLQGYFGNEKLPNPAMDAYTAKVREFNQAAFDPAAYDLNLAIQIWDRRGQVIEQSEFTEGSTETLTLNWTAPAEDWYTVTVVRNEENPGTAGVAWLKIDNLEVFYSTPTATRQRLERFGEPPQLNCQGCAISTNRTDLRFNGERTLAQWFSLQLAPFLVEIRVFYVISLVVATIGYGIGWFLKTSKTRQQQVSLFIGSLWLIGLLSIVFLIAGLGGLAGKDFLPSIEARDLGGIFLTILLSGVSIVASFPIGVILALGRQSDLPVVSFLCTMFIEVVRGVPLITLLFMGYLIMPFLIDGMENVSLVIRMAIVFTLFTSAYLAEIIRGGLQIVPKGQTEAARALGLPEIYITGLIVLPQAIRAVIPAIMGQFVSLLKDTSLLALVGLFELTGAMRRLLADTQTGYTLFQREGYLYIGIVYFILCYALAEASRRVEETGVGAARH